VFCPCIAWGVFVKCDGLPCKVPGTPLPTEQDYNSTDVLFNIATFRSGSGWSPNAILFKKTHEVVPHLLRSLERQAPSPFSYFKTYTKTEITEYAINNNCIYVIFYLRYYVLYFSAVTAIIRYIKSQNTLRKE
jgi:hypothetical protein